MTAGNCAQACVAYLMGLDLDEVPDFTGGNANVRDTLFWERFHEFMDSRDLEAVLIDRRGEGEKVAQPRGRHLACGMTDRGLFHMCVYEGEELHYDPHPSEAGLLSVAFYWLVVPMNLEEWQQAW